MSHQSAWRSARRIAPIAAALAAVFGLPGSGTAQNAPKIVTIVLPVEPVGLDGCNTIRANVGRVIRQNVVESLTERDPKDGMITPRLATAWEKVDDKTWRFTLRQGVKFHDGAPFDAKAVVTAMDRTMKQTALGCENKTKSFGDIKLETRAVSDHVVEIFADKPVPILPTQMGVIGITGPNTPTDKLVLDPVGTGPYIFGNWVSGQEINIKRNPNYWGTKPQADGARYLWRTESSVRAAMVKVGEADIAPSIAAEDATDPKTDTSYINSETASLRIDNTIAPLTDKRVRLALNYAFDREKVRGSILPKDILNATQIVVPNIAGHNHEIDKKVRAYDPNKAKQLLAEAKADGVPVDKEIVLIGRPTGYPNAGEVMEAILQMYKAVGLNVTLRNMAQAEWQETLNKPFKEGRAPTLLQAFHDNNNGDPVFSVFNKYACGGLQATLCDPKLDELIAKASAQSGQERVETWREVLRNIYEDQVNDVWLYHMVGYARVGGKVSYTPSILTTAELQLSQVSFK